MSDEPAARSSVADYQAALLDLLDAAEPGSESAVLAQQIADLGRVHLGPEREIDPQLAAIAAELTHTWGRLRETPG